MSINPIDYMQDTEKLLYGIYRGVVERNDDPERIGRVRVRVPFLHGVEGSDYFIKSDMLPWAFPCLLSASQDSGTFIIPEIGNIVWVMFEAGVKDKPIYIGSLYGICTTTLKYLGTNDEKSETYIQSDGRRSKQPYQREIPLEVYEDNEELFPSKKVLYKSPKGAAVMMDERDEKESLSIIDRFGQTFIMKSATKQAYNRDNGGARKSKSVIKGDKPPLDRLVNNAVIALKDAAHQVIKMVSSATKSTLQIIGRKDNRLAGIEINNTGSSTEILISNEGSSPVQIRVLEDGIKLDTGEAYIYLSKNSIRLSASSIYLDGRVSSSSIIADNHNHTCPDGETSYTPSPSPNASGPSIRALEDNEEENI